MERRWLMRRIVIMGPLGAGKSTLALKLGRLLGIPVHHLDRLYWGDTWMSTPPVEWQALLSRLVAGESWIIDGNFTSSLPQRLAAADTVIYLDIPPLTSTIRAIGRRIFHWWRRARACPAKHGRCSMPNSSAGSGRSQVRIDRICSRNSNSPRSLTRPSSSATGEM
jgi:adenylate kinase family enzyme